MSKYTYLTTNMISTKRLLFIFSVCFLLSSAEQLFAQTAGDYRSRANGLWSESGTWQVYNGTAWVDSAGVYPAAATSPTKVTIQHNVVANISVWEDLTNIDILAAGTLSFSTYTNLRYTGILANAGTCPDCATKLYQIANGDYRSVSSTDWNEPSNWEQYSGGAWANATTYPGEVVPGTAQVFVRAGTEMALSATPPNELDKLVIEDGGTLLTNSCNVLMARVANIFGNYTPSLGKLIVLNNDDMRTIGGGSWTDASKWEKYSAGAWIAATETPGLNANTTNRDRDVIVSNVMTLPAPVSNLAGNIYVASGGTITTGGNALAVTTLKNCGMVNSLADISYGITNYRSISGGDWSDITVWQASTDGGTTFFAATQYPGEAPPSATQVVTIQTGHNVTLDISPLEDIGSLSVVGTMGVVTGNTVRYEGSCTSCPGSATVKVNTNDYRSKATGNWGATGTWEQFNGTKWINATDYPGQNAVVGTPKIFIRYGHTVELDVTPANETHTLFVEKGGIFQISLVCNNLKLLATPTINGAYFPTLGTYIVLSVGDFRSAAGGGSWGTIGTWEQFNGTAWGAATAFPGQDASNVKNVIIRSAVTLDATPIEDTRDLLIESTGSLTITGLFDIRYRGTFTNCGTYTAGIGEAFQVNTNDFRTVVGGGTWNLTTTWERFDGTNWVAATVYPGQNPAAGEEVFVRTGTTTVTATPPNAIDRFRLEQPATITVNTGVTLTAEGASSIFGTVNLIGTGLLNYANLGDYRSVATGNWSSPSTWEKFSNSGWGAASDYPGQNFATKPPRVSILTGHSVTTDVSPLNDIQNVTIIGTLTFNGTMGTNANTIRSRTAHTISGGTCVDCATNVIVIVNGDYRSTGTGNWATNATWEKFVNSTWVASTDYPGVADPTSNTSRVFVRNTHTVTLDLTPLNDIGRLFVESGATYLILFSSPGSLRARNAITVNGTYTANNGDYYVVATNDYRSIASSNWSVTTTWQRFNGTTWAAATDYPGQTTAAYGSVYVRRTHTVGHNISPAEDINALRIENGGVLNITACNNLTMRGNFTLLGTAPTSPALDNLSADRFIRLQNLDYRSNVATGNWNATGSWQQFNGTTWVAPFAGLTPGALAPVNGQNTIIRTGHNITFNANPANNLFDIYVLSGGTLSDGSALYPINLNGRTVVNGECGTVAALLIAKLEYLGDRFYRSRASGNWSDFNTWEVAAVEAGPYTNATAGNYPGVRQPPVNTPTSKVIIASGFTVTVDVSPYADLRSLQVNAGGTLTFPAAGGVGYNIKVHTAVGISNAGTINNIHTATGITNTGTINVVTNTSTFTLVGLASYRTVASGNWNNLNTWQFFNPASQWVKATIIPGTVSNNASFIIRTGHTVTTDIAMAATTPIGNLVIENGATLTANANSNISLTGNFINHGTFTPTEGSVTFRDNVALRSITGAASPANYSFYNVVMNVNSGTAVTTSKDFSITNSFRNTGTLTTNVFSATTPSEITFSAGGTASISGVSNIIAGTFPSTTFNNPISFFKLTASNSTKLNVSTPITVAENLSLLGNASLVNTSEVIISKTIFSDGASGSVFTNSTNGYLRYRSSQLPFVGATSALDATANNNQVDYDFPGNQTIYPATYFNLQVTNGGTKTIDVGTTRYEVRNLLRVSRGLVTTVRTDMIVNGTTGRLLNFKADVGRRCNYTYNANTNTISANQLPAFNGPGLSNDPPGAPYASNFSGRFNRIYISDDDQQNSITSSSLSDISLERGSSGSVRAVRTLNIPDVPNAAIVRFDVVGTVNNVSAVDAGFMVIGNLLADDDVQTGANVASRLSFGFGGSSNISITHQGTANTTAINNFTPNTTTSRRKITWVINTSGASITYTTPLGGTDNVPANTVDIWEGNIRRLDNLAVTNNGVTLNSLKLILKSGAGSFTLENIRINPISELRVNNYTQTNLSGSTAALCLPSLPFVITTNAGASNAGYTTVSSSSPNSAYNPSNQFLIQLSRPDGSFSSFTQIGALSSTNPSSLPNVVLTIPQNILPTMASGTGFRIRVVSTDPPMISTPSTINLNIRSYGIVRNSDNVVPDLQAVTTTAPNQLTQTLKVNGVPTPVPSGTTYQWWVRYIPTGATYQINGATAVTFQGDGLKTDNDGTPSASNTPNIHFHAGTGLYDLYCVVNTGTGGCGTVTTSPVKIVVECTGCTKNPRPYANCVKNLVFNGTFTAGVWGGQRSSGTTSLDTPVFPASMPDPNDPNSEGMIPFESTGNPYGTITPDITFSPYSPPYGSLATPNAAQLRRQKTRSYVLANGATAVLRLNTPYGFSTEYGGVTAALRQSDMSLETDANTVKGGGTMAPENQWAVTAQPRFYMGDVCDADGTDYSGSRNPAGGGSLWGSAATGTTWNYTSAGTGVSIAPNIPSGGRGGPPFTALPIQVTSYNGNNNPNYTLANIRTYPYNSSPSGGRLEIANGDYGTAAKMWTQRFKVRKNTDYVFSFWAVNLNSISAIYGVFANCTQIGNNLLLQGNDLRCVWQQYTYLWNSGELTTVEFSVRNISTVRSGNDLGIDDIMFYRCDGNTNIFPSANKFLWRGFNTDWFNPDNWGNCVLPDCDADVIIPAESTNPAASSLLGTYYFPIIQASANTSVPNAYTGGHPAYDLTNARNINTSNLAKVRTLTIEHGATLTIKTEAGPKPWNLDICGDLIAKKNAAADPDIMIDWLKTLDVGTANDYRSSITFTSTAGQLAAQTASGVFTPTIISGDFLYKDGSINNPFPNLIIRKQSVNQIVQLSDDIDIYGNFALVDGTFDANGKSMRFQGDNFISGADNTDAFNPKGIGNQFFNYPPLLPTFLNDESGSGPNTLSGASFVHNNGTVTFSKAAAGDQSYYRSGKLATLCPTCAQEFYNLIVNEPALTSNLDIIRGDLIIDKTLTLTNGYITGKLSTGAREVYLTDSDPATSLVGGSANSYIVTTNDGYTASETNLKLRRDINGADFATKSYKFPVGGDASGAGNVGVLQGYRELNFKQNTALTGGAVSVRAYFDARNASVAYTTPKLPGTRFDVCSGNSLLYDFCTGGYWDLKPLNVNGTEVSLTSGISYNLNMPSIPSAFTCGTPTLVTFAKRSDEADNWGFGNSCYIDPATRNTFTTFTKFSPVSTVSPLPVEFLSFDAFKNNLAVDVKWETISERNSSHFIVQRSTDGKNFVAIGRVEARGNATSNIKYIFVDEKPVQGINYYRLLQVDLDGKETLTKVVSVTFDGEGQELQVFPNPSSEGIGFNLILPRAAAGNEIEIRMMDALGRQMFFQRFKFEGGVIQLPADFAKGFYTLIVATPKENYVRKLVVK